MININLLKDKLVDKYKNKMRNFLLFLSTLACWAPTWYLIKFQFGVVDPLVSVFYRFLFASLILFIILRFNKKKLFFSIRDHSWFLIFGISLFSLNYIFFYLANTYLISGIVTIAFSSILIMNILGEKFYFGVSSSKQTWLAALIGIVGIFIIFHNELSTFKWNNSIHLGIALSFIATFWASTGNMIHQRNFNYKIPFFPSLAYGMFYGSLFTLAIAKIRGAALVFDYSTTYIFSLLYLILFGSVFGFYLYLSLLERIGSARAGYIGVIMPIAALTISTIFEGLEWNQNLIFGLPILILGCILILNQKSKNRVKQ